MHFKCTKCSARSKVYSRREMSVELSALYYACSSPTCGHRFVVHLSFSHTIAPPANEFKSLLHELIRQLPVEERAALLQGC